MTICSFLVATVLNAPNSYHWSKYQEKAKALGCRITQNDNEGSFLFDPTNEDQSKLAIEAVQAYRRRIVTEEQRLNLAKHGARTRFSGVKTHVSQEYGK